MTNEEKAKAYDEALKRAEQLYTEDCSAEAKDTCEYIFPELNENENERIRKHIIEILERLSPCHWDGNEKSECIAYLEKQKEQKPVKLNDDTEVGIDRALQIVKDAKGNLYGYKSDDGIYECDHAIQTLEHILRNGIEQKPVEWSEEDSKLLNRTLSIIRWASDSDRQNRIIGDAGAIELEDWLKSRRPIWKPSEEQMKALDFVLCHYTFLVNGVRNGLVSLHDDLKKQL